MRILLIALGALVAGCAMQRAGDDLIVPVDLTQPSWIVFHVPARPGAASPSGLTMTRLDPSTGALSDFSYWFANTDEDGSYWHFFNARQGTYVLESASVMRDRNIWTLCFNSPSYAITVADGEVVYAGILQLNASLDDLDRQLADQWRPTTPGVVMYVRDGAVAPTVGTQEPTAEEMETARTAIARSDHASKLPLRWTAPQSAPFRHGVDRSHGCGR